MALKRITSAFLVTFVPSRGYCPMTGHRRVTVAQCFVAVGAVALGFVVQSVGWSGASCCCVVCSWRNTHCRVASLVCATFALFNLILTSDAPSLSFAQPRRTCCRSCHVGALPMMQRSFRTSGATRRRTAQRALPVTTSFTGRRPSWVRYVLLTCPWLRVVVAGMFEACPMVLRVSSVVGSSIHHAVTSFVRMVHFLGGC